MKTSAELIDLFRSQGRKITSQRVKIFEILEGNSAHPTAEAVYAQLVRELPTVSLKTVYKTLHELVDLGEVSSLDLGTGSCRFDPNKSVHHHMVCDGCHMVKDLYLDVRDISVPSELAEGFELGEAEITFRGLCSTCRTSC